MNFTSHDFRLLINYKKYWFRQDLILKIWNELIEINTVIKFSNAVITTFFSASYIKIFSQIQNMPVGIIPDIGEQMCIGCALCVEICTSLGPDVLRVKPVEGWKRGKAFVFYPERCISDGACIGVCPTKAIFWMRPMDFTPGQPVPLYRNSVFVKGWTELID